jgi:hypothetical protein
VVPQWLQRVARVQQFLSATRVYSRNDDGQ